MDKKSQCISLKALRLNKLAASAFAFAIILAAVSIILPQPAFAYTMSNSYFNVQTGSNGEISSLQLTGDAFPTNYVMNATNSPKQNTSGHQWLGELMFEYRVGSGAWTKATTNQSSDARVQSQNGNTVTVTYQNSANANGVKNFQLTETYSLVSDYLRWEIKLKNTGTQNIEFGDVGLPLPFNERWPSGEAIYETRVVSHSNVANNNSYVYATRPSGIGSFLLMTPDASTGAGFEYKDHWRTQERAASEAAWCQDQADWPEGLNVFYIHSNRIKSTNRGYLPNTSLTLTPGQEKAYAFKFFKVADTNAMKERLYSEGLIDVNVVPGMIVPSNQTAKVDLHTSKSITSVTAQYPSETTITYLTTVATNHKIYSLSMRHLGQNDITVNYGSGEKTVLQFYVTEPVDAALQRHATFMVNSTQQNTSDFKNKAFDDWMMDTKSKRNSFSGYWGWGDDWGYTHGQFLAEKNVLTPVASEIQAVDNYLETTIWNSLMKQHQNDYYIHDFLMYSPGDVSGECKIAACGNNTPMGRGYAYPHIYNTFFSMYKIAKLHPEAITYKNPAKTYLYRAYRIMKTLYDGSVAYNWRTGLMGEQSTPQLIQALRDEGYTTEANDLTTKMATKYNNFRNTTYPYGSEYSYDNTGEEAVYTLAKMNNNTTMMSKINAKTRACRGTAPVWYYYANPTTICGENWWQFQYTMALAGYCMDDWMLNYSTTPETDARLNYAAKIGLISTINSGQIDPDPANIGAVSWTYQAEKGNLGAQGVGGGALHNGWRQMSGEADLGLWGVLKILSADVANDPIFGLTGYGCDVTQSGSNYVITPKDGLFKRLNMIGLKLSMVLEQDEYTSATIGSAKNYVEVTLKNKKTAAHTTKVTLKGLAAGTYDILVNNVKTGSFTAVSGQASDININVGTAATYNVKVQQGTPAQNTAPTVDAGANGTFVFPTVSLSGTSSDDGLPSGTLTNSWSLQSGPGTATFANANALNTTATVSATGTYIFRLTASDGSLSSYDTVTMTVNPAPADGNVLWYKFDETGGTTAADSSGGGKNGTLTGGATWAAGRNGNAVSLSGSSQYVSLPSGVVSGLNDFTIATWVRVNTLSDWARIFDFGTGTNTYMFLTPRASGAGLRFAITTGSNGSEQQINATALPAGVWKHVAVTLSGSTGILYVDGVEVARNTAMTLKPSSLGTTNLNYIGRSQWSDPYLNGLVDDFKVYNKALSASEISTLASASAAAAADMELNGADLNKTEPDEIDLNETDVSGT